MIPRQYLRLSHCHFVCNESSTVQLTSKLTLTCSKHTCVLQFLSWLKSKHVCDMKWATHESTFLYCMWAIFMCCTWVIVHVLHDSKKHVTSTSCAARKTAFLCTACRLTAIFCQRRIKPTQQNVIKCVTTNKIIFCQVFTYLYCNPL